MDKPVLFLDFDRTLFDTAQLRLWLGDDLARRIEEIVSGTLELPELPPMLYPDTIPFLERARGTRRLVLLSCTSYPIFQDKKVKGSGVVPFFDDVLIVERIGASSGKGIAAREYLEEHVRATAGHTFVDDLPENISEVKALNPAVRCIRIERDPPEAHKTPGPESLPPDAQVADLTELLALL